MAEGDTFGSGLNFNAGDPATGAASNFGEVPAEDAGADASTSAAGPAAVTGPERGGQAPRGSTQQPAIFGSGLSLGPRYVPPDPQATETAQAADLVQQRIKRANDIANNPLAAFFNPDAVQKARDFVSGEGAAKLQALRTQQQQQADIQKSAANYGIPKADINPYMTNDTIDNMLLERYKSGDFSAANALKARGKGEWVQDFAGAALDGAGARLKAADTAATKLSAAGSSQAAYDAVRKNLTPEDQQALTSMGVTTIPEKVADWNALTQQHGAKFAQAMQQQSQLAQRYANMTNFDTSVPKDQEAALQGDVRLGSTNEPAGFPIRTRAIDGQPGHVGPQKSAMTENYGLSPKNGGWSAWSPEREKSFQAVLNQEDVKGAVNQYNIANKFRHEAADEKNYTSAAGLALLKDTLGGVGRDVAEKSAAAGTTGLTKMMTQQQGGFEGWVNRAQNEIGAFQNWLNGGKKGPEPRLSDATKKGLQLVAETNYQYALEQAKGRLGGAMTYAGQGGKPLDQIPLDADLRRDLAPAHEEGRQDAINGYRALPSIVRGDQRIFFTPGANVPGAIPPRGPLTPSTPPGTQAPAAGQTPATALGPNQPAAPNTSPGGSGPRAPAAPITVAGQQVNVPLPPGASANFVPNLQRIETGNERSPWTAGTKGSSASGAFQAIKSTWNQFKPSGAPDRAGDATPEQQAQFLTSFTAHNAGVLASAGLPVNDTNLYITHNLGEGNGPKLLKADPKADARTVVGEENARNNPLFFRGRPTVATALARYEGAMNGTLDTKAGASSTFDSRLSQMMPGLRRSQAANDLAANAVDYAPAIGGTAGAVIGGATGGPVGAVAGGAAGSAGGQALKDSLQGRNQSPTAIAKQAALGGVLGVVPAGRPLVGAALRAAGVGGVEAGAEALQGGSVGDVVEAGAKGVGFALAGEALGRFVSSAGATAYKALSRYTQTAQAELSAQAGKLADARKVLETEQPKLPGEGSGANPKYEAAKKAADDATAAIKDHGQNPDDMVHAYEQAKGPTPVSSGEAAVLKGAASEKRDVSAGYNDLRSQVNEAGVGAVKPAGKLPDGPVSMLRTVDNPTGKVPAQFKPEADHAEMLIKAPAKDWGEKWQQLQDAGSELIQKRMAFLQAGDKPSADAMDALFKGVRNQQKAAAEYVFGKEQGAKAITKLESLDMRYAKIMNATQGMNYEKMRGVLAQGNTPAARELEKNFREFAKDDPGAIRAFNAMKAGARGDWKSEAALMGPVIMGEVAANLHGIPTVGAISALVGAQRLYKLVQGYMNAKVLGKAVTFKDFLAQEIRKPEFHSAAQRAVVQGVAQ